MTVVLPGFHAVKHALRFDASIAQLVTVDQAKLAALAADLAPDLADAFAAAVAVTPAELAELADLVPASGVAAVATKPSVDAAEVWASADHRPVVVLEEPTHHGNIGAVVRVAAAAEAAGVLTTGPLDPWHPAALRGSAGLHFAMRVARVAAVPDGGEPLVAWDPAGTPLADTALPAGGRHAFGSERRGLSPALLRRADTVVAIPMRPGVSSLNLATSVAVALYSLPQPLPDS